MSNMLKGIRYCSPVFVGCYGEMLGLPVNRKAISASHKEELAEEFPFLGSEVFDPAQQQLMSTTEVELMEALFIPAMEAELFPDGRDGDKYSFAESVYAFVRHPSLMSINFPDHLAHIKGVNTISNIKRHKAECKDVLAKITDIVSHKNPIPPKYANESELNDMVVSAMESCIEKIWSSDTTPEYLDRFAIETEVR